jgi:hypothetical protein
MSDDNKTNDNDDETTTDDETEARTFQVSVTRTYETDFRSEQIEQVKDQLESESAESAIENLACNREARFVEPQEKLVGVEADVEEV